MEWLFGLLMQIIGTECIPTEPINKRLVLSLAVHLGTQITIAVGFAVNIPHLGVETQRTHAVRAAVVDVSLISVDQSVQDALVVGFWHQVITAATEWMNARFVVHRLHLPHVLRSTITTTTMLGL